MLHKLRRKTLHQNFLWNRQLVKRLVRNSSIGKNDLVYEIGPGRGIITEQLSQIAWKVIAIELDPKLALRLKSQSKHLPNLEVHNQDFLKFDIYSKRYKIFANPPFTISGDIIKKILHSKNPPIESYLVLQKEFAEKLMGIPYESQASIQYKPWFEMKVVHNFSRYDFSPPATVDCVLLYIIRLDKPLLPPHKKKSFIKFLRSHPNIRSQKWTKSIEDFMKL